MAQYNRYINSRKQVMTNIKWLDLLQQGAIQPQQFYLCNLRQIAGID
jgi:hypothetical protein